jgi:hypothetical protein
VCVGKAQSSSCDIPPTLYNIFTSDALNAGECELATFAYDTAMFVSDTIPTVVCGKLQRQLDTLSDYFKNWKIRVNPTKTQAIYFNRCASVRNLPASCLKFNGHEMHWSPEVRYLSLNFDKKLTAKSTDRAKKAFRILYSFLKRRSKLCTFSNGVNPN